MTEKEDNAKRLNDIPDEWKAKRMLKIKAALEHQKNRPMTFEEAQAQQERNSKDKPKEKE